MGGHRPTKSLHIPGSNPSVLPLGDRPVLFGVTHEDLAENSAVPCQANAEKTADHSSSKTQHLAVADAHN